jgi:hypothetical protein
MTKHSVSLKVTPCVRIECKFWLADDGWNRTSDAIPVVVQGGSFEQVKSDMESALGKHIEKLLRERGEDKAERAA